MDTNKTDVTSKIDVDALVKDMASIVRPIVKIVEAGPKATMGRYDQYMAVIARLMEQAKKPNKAMMLGVGCAMIEAGADRQGVIAALTLLGAMD